MGLSDKVNINKNNKKHYLDPKQNFVNPVELSLVKLLVYSKQGRFGLSKWNYNHRTWMIDNSRGFYAILHKFDEISEELLSYFSEDYNKNFENFSSRKFVNKVMIYSLSLILTTGTLIDGGYKDISSDEISNKVGLQKEDIKEKVFPFRYNNSHIKYNEDWFRSKKPNVYK